jgi:hypothetical protein
MLYLTLLVPLAVVVGGRLVIVVLDLLSRLGTATLVFSTYQIAPKLAVYYSITAGIVALMIQNSIILSPLFVQENVAYEGAIALGLAFLPRVVSFASSVERGRSVLITILAPLALTSLTLVALKPGDLAIHPEPFGVVLLGVLPTIALGDFALYVSAWKGFLKPELALDRFDRLKVQETVSSHLDSYRYSDLGLVLETIKFALDRADELHNQQAKLEVATAIVSCLEVQPLVCKPLSEIIERLSASDSPAVLEKLTGSYGFVLDYNLTLGLSKLARMSDHSNPGVRKKVVEVCMRKWEATPDVKKILLSAMERFLRNARVLTVDFLEMRALLSASSSGGVKGEELTQHQVYLRQGGIESLTAEGVFQGKEFVVALEKAWEVDPSRMSSIVEEFSHDKDPMKRLVAVVLLADATMGSKITNRDKLLSELLKDKQLSVMAEAMRGLSELS